MEIAKKMLAANSSYEFVQQMTGFSMEDIEQIHAGIDPYKEGDDDGESIDN